MGDLWKRATIPFEKPLAEKGVRELFGYLVKNTPGAEVSYTVERQGRVAVDPEKGEPFTEEHPTRLHCSVCTTEMPLLSMFEVVREPITQEHQSYTDNLALFYGLRSDAAGYDFEGEVPEHDLEMIDAVRQKTQDFFESRNE